MYDLISDLIAIDDELEKAESELKRLKEEVKKAKGKIVYLKNQKKKRKETIRIRKNIPDANIDDVYIDYENYIEWDKYLEDVMIISMYSEIERKIRIEEVF